MNAKLLRSLHRWIGLACALTVLAASGSGILHVVMTWKQSAPPRPLPAEPLPWTEIRLSPAEVLTKSGRDAATVRSLQVCRIAGEPWYQITGAENPEPQYFSARDGRIGEDCDRRYALEIAQRFLPAATMRWTRRLDRYDGEYIAIFRLLPVHRIDVDDGRGTRLYVSTLTGSVARHTDDSRQLEANLFSLVHKYSFIPSKSWRDGLLVTFTALAFLTSLAGIFLFALTRSRRSTSYKT